MEKEAISESPKVRFPAFRVGIVIALLFITALVYGMISQKDQNVSQYAGSKDSVNNQQKDDKNTQWVKPASEKKGVPFLDKDQKLSIYALDSKKISAVGSTMTRGGAMGFGNSDPIASPDLLYTAYISKDDSSLWIVSNDTLEKKVVQGSTGVGYISGWSLDSKKIYYNVSNETITTKTQGMGGIPNDTVKFNPILSPGFFSFNIETGEVKKLYPVEYIDAVMDSDRLLTRPQDQLNSTVNDTLVVFNTKTFEADYSTVKEKFAYGSLQFHFTQDGTKWVFSYSKNPTNDMSIVYADFPNKEGTIIDSGAWAEVQFPTISPDGAKVAYSKRNGLQKENMPYYQIWVYDTATKEKKSFNVEGWVIYWVDDNNVVVSASNASKFEYYLNLLNLSTGTVTKIY